MIAVQSLWTGTTKFVLTRKLAMLFSASAAYLNDWYPHTELVTDMCGLEIAERLGWNYTSFSTALDTFCPKELRHVWCLGKIFASSIQSKSHVHVDLDLFLMGRFKARIEGARVAAHSKDPPGFYRMPRQREMLAMAGIPDYVTPHNTGILLWNDLELRDAYVKAATDALHKVGKSVECGTSVTVCIEQAAFSNLMRERGVKVEEICLLPIPGMIQPEDMPTPFVHFWGRSKRNDGWMQRAEELFAENYPAQYAAFKRGFAILEKAGRIPTISHFDQNEVAYYYGGEYSYPHGPCPYTS